jgi:hypothetical protein
VILCFSVPRRSSETVQNDERGSLRVEHLDAGLFRTTVTGHFSTSLLSPYVRALDKALAAGRAVGFHDWEGMNTYDAECRKVLTEWTLQHRARIDGWHILVRSKLVAMGVATASLLIGGGTIVSYTDRDKFESSYRQRSGL